MKKRAYAKVNIGLKVVGKRNDGFHELETIMTRVSLFDIIEFKKSEKIEVQCPNVLKEDNIVYKIAKYLQEKYNIKKGIKIVINKKIPFQAGLGGGSSDAAVTINVLNKIWKLGLSYEKKMEIANMFGSDICFFLKGKPSFVYGKGEKLKNIKIKKRLFFLLVKPKIGFDTKKVFSFVKEYSEKKCLDNLIEKLSLGLKIDCCDTINDLEVAFLKENKDSEILKIKEKIKKYNAYFYSLSGSGSTYYGIFSNEKERKKAYDDFKNDIKEVYKVYNL